MTYIFTIYLISALGTTSAEGLAPNFAACKAEVARIILELNPPPFTRVYAKCSTTEYTVEV